MIGGSHLVALQHWMEDEREAALGFLRTGVKTMEDYRYRLGVLDTLDKIEDHLRGLMQERQVLAGRETYMDGYPNG